MKLWKYVLWVLIFCYTVSIITLVILFAEFDFSDETLFFLLTVLRYIAFLVFISSVYMLVECVFRVLNKTHNKRLKLPLIGIFMSIASALYGAILFLIEIFLVSISSGNILMPGL